MQSIERLKMETHQKTKLFSGEPDHGGEKKSADSQKTLAWKIGRTSWIGYLVVAFPAVCLLGTIFFAVLMISQVSQDYGPVESEMPTPFEQGLAWLAIFGLPVMWLLGFFFAHRFEQAGRRLIPFLANLFPALAFVWFSVELSLEDDNESSWMVVYSGLLVILLLVGMIAVLTDRRSANPS